MSQQSFTGSGQPPSVHQGAQQPPAQQFVPQQVTPQFAGRAPQRSSAGLAIASLVLGILAALGCLIPVVNLFSMLLAVIGGTLGAIVLLRGLGGRGMAIAGTILSALALIGAIIANLLFGAAVDSVASSLETPTADTAVSAPASADAGSAEAGSAEAGSADAAVAPATGQLAVGETATTGDYTVTVTGVNSDANALVAEANMFNEPPTGQYVVADVTVTYNGAETATPWLDLSFTFQGTDARNYDTATCMLPNSAVNQPDLRTGGTASFGVCYDVPAAAIGGGAIQAKEFLKDPQTWAVN